MQTMNINKDTQAGWGKWLYACLAVLFAVTLGSCDDSTESVDEFPNWQSKNESYFNSLYATTVAKVAAGDKSWKVIKSFAYENGVHNDPQDHIVVQVLSEGTGTESPLYTDTVRVHYQGRLLPSTSYAQGFVFDTSWNSDTFSPTTSAPAKFVVSGLVEGFTTALQHMRKGDHWLVTIPHQLAYGATAQSTVPAYSTLVFDISLDSFYHPSK